MADGTEEKTGQAQSLDPDLTADGICGENNERLQKVQFVDDPEDPRGRGRLDLSTGERY